MEETPPTLLKLAYSCLIPIILLSVGCKKSSNLDNSFTAGANIYIAGRAGASAVYWKNGKEIDIPGMTVATGIAVSGTTVYTCGISTVHDQLAAWARDTIVTNLTASGTAYAYGICLSGSDVYVAGDWSQNNLLQAVYWKNNIPTYLSNNPSSFATAIAVKDSEIYVGGAVGDSSVCWNNGVQRLFSVGGSPWLSAIAISGNDVYFAGGSPAG